MGNVAMSSAVVTMLATALLCVDAAPSAAERLKRNLLEIGRGKSFVWGHTLDQGDWNDPAKLGRLRRETGISPVLYATDFRNCFGTFYSPEHYASNRATLAALIKREYDGRHAVPVISWHFANPYIPRGWKAYSTGAQPFRYRYGAKGWRQKEPYPEEHRWVLREIAEGTGDRCGFGRANGKDDGRSFPNPRAWYEWNLKEAAAFCRTLTDKDGKRIPLMFRFFHECECDWFWWGSGSSTPQDYIAAWRLTVDILRRELGRENVLFCYCTDRKWGKIGEEGRSGFLERYPGDDYIDVIGYDDYELGEDRNPKDGKHIDASKSSAAVANRMRLISAEGERRGKICGIFECGIMSASGHYAGVDAFYSELRKVMTAPGVKFAFAHTYTGAWTYPHNEAGWADMRAVLNGSDVITDKSGVDLTAPMPTDVPDLLTTFAGEKVATREQWETVRAPELLEEFAREAYGKRPVERPGSLTFEQAEPDAVMMDGKALRKRIRVKYAGPYGSGSFVFTAFIPRQGKPAPSFVHICILPPHENIDPERKIKSPFWPAEEIVSRGYAAIAFWNGDVAPDINTGNSRGVFAAFRDVNSQEAKKDGWGTLSAWAWGASRVMDWIETEPLLDARHVAVVGHSRGGKTALVAGVYDKRFAMACSNDSGCSGAKLNHIDLPKSEHLAQIMRSFQYWVCPNYTLHVNAEREWRVDQHEFIALMAPRLVCIASASEDAWAGPEGEYWSGVLASPAWELYGKKGLVTDGFPPPEKPLQKGCISYHLRNGRHDLTPYDWARYMDFADRHGWRD